MFDFSLELKAIGQVRRYDQRGKKIRLVEVRSYVEESAKTLDLPKTNKSGKPV